MFPQAPQFALFEARLTQLPRPPRGPTAHCVSPAGQSHVPLKHAPPNGHAVPQAPQLAGFVRRSTQIVAPPRPAGQAVSPPLPQPATQAPAEQVVPPRQTRPQPPQFALSEAGFTQVAPHRSSPGEHAHPPPAQDAPFGHCVLQAPQCAGFVRRSTHALLQSESAAPASSVPQLALQVPPLQTGAPPIGGQTFPHAPQLFGSFWVWKQTLLQRIPWKHWQVPPWHVVPAPHSVPQAPQLLLFEERSTHAVPHWASPPGHTHDPALHTRPLCALQTRPQAPQLFGSV